MTTKQARKSVVLTDEQLKEVHARNMRDMKAGEREGKTQSEAYLASLEKVAAEYGISAVELQKQKRARMLRVERQNRELRRQKDGRRVLPKMEIQEGRIAVPKLNLGKPPIIRFAEDLEDELRVLGHGQEGSQEYLNVADAKLAKRVIISTVSKNLNWGSDFVVTRRENILSIYRK